MKNFSKTDMKKAGGFLFSGAKTRITNFYTDESSDKK